MSYNTKRIKEMKSTLAIKRNFLTELFFPKEDPQDKRTIQLEIERAGEQWAPFITEMQEGKPMPSTTKQALVITIPEVAPSYALKPEDYFQREVGQPETVSIVANVAKKTQKVLERQEVQIANKEEMMVSQFLTTGKIISSGDEAAVEIDYKVPNISVLPADKMWDKAGTNPEQSLKEIILDAEATGIKTEAIVFGSLAAEKYIESLRKNNALSLDNQSEYVKKMLRKFPGISYIGVLKGYGIDLFSYKRTIYDYKGKQTEILPENMVIGGPKNGTIIYGPIIDTKSKGSPLQIGKRYSWVDTPN